MAQAAAAAPARRPHNALFLLVFLAGAGVFGWLMRVSPALANVPAGFVSAVEDARFADGTPLETWYTGLAALDGAAKFLVAAFLAGPARWDAGVHAQQSHFLVNWFAVLCVWNVEACRRRNAGRLVSFMALFALLYQTIGVTVIAPLYYALYVQLSAGDAYHSSGREVPLAYARTLLPAAVLGYLVPTVALYYIPWSDIATLQYVTALWQPSPIFVSVLLLCFSFLLPPSSSSAASSKNADVKHLKRIYLVAGLVSAAAHISTLYNCLASSSGNPQLSLSYVFLPNKAAWRGSMAAGLHYIFQWDFWGTFTASLFWCWLVVYDVLRILIGKPSAVQLFQAVLGIGLVALVAGPGAAIVAVWNWREDRLVMIENGVRGTWKKPKAA
ncbi:hypothetical protein AAE478_006916 [Parahypoxylon ruwenzoriense]